MNKTSLLTYFNHCVVVLWSSKNLNFIFFFLEFIYILNYDLSSEPPLFTLSHNLILFSNLIIFSSTKPTTAYNKTCGR